MTLKEKVLMRYRQIVNDKIDVFQDMISSLSADAQNDAKSSAGDKHETALSMMHLEQEKLNAKLAECLAQKAVLEKINVRQTSNRVVLGSLVTVNNTCIFMSLALQKITVDEVAVLAVSPQSPLGSMVLGNAVGHAFVLNGSEYVITSIL